MIPRPGEEDETAAGGLDPGSDSTRGDDGGFLAGQGRTWIHSTGCPSREQLELFAAGASDLRGVADHLPRCPVCREIVVRIAEDDAFVAEFVQANRDAGDATGMTPLGGEVVPGFQVEGEIHRGGQGVVYRAVQLSTRRTVALKTMLQGRFATTRQRLRFEREVEIVASLRHPNIVTLFESGRTRDGLAFFAMELVAGRPLNQVLADEKRPSRDELLAMFVPLVHAVAYAHRRGVIHRDLKPGNILVDEEAKPHVLDFGLARTARGEDQADLEATAAGEFLGTFAYAAPEQLKGDPDQIDVRTDVFALGVILYEILAGERPWQPVGRASIADLLMARLEQAPLPPSELRSDIDGDLDVIALKCLKAAPEERYQTADALVEDVERFLDGRPILARPDSLAYSMRKWVARHRLATATVAGVAVLVVGFAISFAVLWGLAERNRVQAERTLRSFRDTLRSINPETGRGSLQMTALEFLDLVEDEAHLALEDQPLVSLNLLNTVEAIRLAFSGSDGDVERAKRNLDLAEEVAEASGRAATAEVAEALHNLGRAHLLAGEMPAAEARYRRALEVGEKVYGRNAPQTAMTMQHLASCLRRQQKLDQAEEIYRRVLDIQRKAHGPESAEVAAVLNGQAFVIRSQGHLERALGLFESATAMISRLAGPDDFRVGGGLMNVAQTKLQLNRPGEAAADLRRALNIVIARKGPLTPTTFEARRQLVIAILRAGEDPGEAVEQARLLCEGLEEVEGDERQRSRAAVLLGEALVAARDRTGALAAFIDGIDLLPAAERASVAGQAQQRLRGAGYVAEADRIAERFSAGDDDRR